MTTTTTTKPSLAGVVLCVLMIYFMVKSTATVSVARPSGFVRQRRSLTFPYGFDESYLEFIFGVGIPMDLPHPYQVLMSIEIRADYRYPVNASDFTNPTKRQEEKEKEKEEKEKANEETAVAKLKPVGLSDVIPIRAGGGSATTLGSTFGSTSKKSNATKYVDDAGSIVKVVSTPDGKSKNSTDKDHLISMGRSEDKQIAKSRPSDVEHENGQSNKDTMDLNGTISSDSNYTGGVNISEEFEDVDFQHEATTLKTGDDASDVEGIEIDLEDSEEEGRVARSIGERESLSDSTRWRIYHVLEMAGNNLGMEGRACLLRSICDAAATPLNHHSNGLVGELVHVLLTPSATEDERGLYEVNQYHAAERLGAEVGNNCRLLFPECEVSFLDLFTKFDL